MKRSRKMVGTFQYRHGGNPPVAAGIFDAECNRLAWWPAGFDPNEANLNLVVETLVQTREHDRPVNRMAIRDLLKARGHPG